MNIEELKDAIKSQPISLVISPYISLSKKGQNFWGVCPFHNDSKPSLSVSDQKGLYKCFACGAAGDHITFVQKFNNQDFKEAIIEIGNNLGLDTTTVFQPKSQDPKKAMAYRILTAAAKLYYRFANQDRPSEYVHFLKNRKLMSDTVQKFQIGFAPKNNMLLHYLKEQVPPDELKFALKVAEEISIIRPDQKTQGAHYDTFRDRIMFPIWNQYGQVVGFSSRAVHDYQKAKYMNSSESTAFHKADILFGLNFAKKAIREKDRVILVEGHMDMIALDQYQFSETVALQGLAISEHMLKKLIDMTKNLYLALDNDTAGFNAAAKINLALLKKGIIAKAVDLSPYKDADELLSAEGSEAFARRLEQAPSFVDYQLDQKLNEGIPEDSDTKIQLLEWVFESLAPLGEKLYATERVINFAKRIGLHSRPEDFLQNYKDYLSGKPKEKQVELPPRATPEAPKPKPNLAPIEEQRPLSKFEKKVLIEIVRHPECVQRPEIRELLDFVHDIRIKQVFNWLQNIIFEIEDTEYESVLKAYISRDELEIEVRECIAEAFFHYQYIKMDERKLSDHISGMVVKLKRERLKEEETVLRKLLSAANTDLEKEEILRKIQNIRRDLLQTTI